MDDLISRQAAIDGKICIQLSNGVEIYSDEAVPVDYLKALPSAQQWIPCSERLPEDDRKVLICRKNGSVGEGRYYSIIGEWSRWDINDLKDVVAWMPLPEPYKEERK